MTQGEERNVVKILGELSVVLDDIVGLVQHGDQLIGEAHRTMRVELSIVDGKPSVLLVDDDELLLHSLHRALKLDFQLATAATIEEAIDLLRAVLFTAVVCDFNLREGTGVDVLRVALREQPEALRILHTGDRSAPVQKLRGGNLVQHLVPKPTDVDSLRELILATVKSK